jgi:hypothetical protein
MFCFLIGQRNNVLSADWLMAWYSENKGTYNTRTLLCSVRVHGTVQTSARLLLRGHIIRGRKCAHTSLSLV